MITPTQRLANLEEAAFIGGKPADYLPNCFIESALLPDLSQLVVKAFTPFHTVAYEHWEKCPPGHYIKRFIDRPTAAGLMAWKWSTPQESLT